MSEKNKLEPIRMPEIKSPKSPESHTQGSPIPRFRNEVLNKDLEQDNTTNGSVVDSQLKEESAAFARVFVKERNAKAFHLWNNSRYGHYLID